MTDENIADVTLEQSQVPEQQLSAAEKMLPQSQVNKIVSREVHEAREKASRAHMAEIERLREQLANQSPAVAPGVSSMGGMYQLSPDQIKQMIAEQTQRTLQAHRDEQIEQMRREYSDKVANEFVQKMELGKHKYPDFDKVVGEVDFRQFPEIVHLTHNLDNAADVVYDLMKNPQKVSTVSGLANRSELLARRSIQELSDSIKLNQQATKSPSASEPLSQLSPSNIGVDDGSMSVSDYRNQPWAMV